MPTEVDTHIGYVCMVFPQCRSHLGTQADTRKPDKEGGWVTMLVHNWDKNGSHQPATRTSIWGSEGEGEEGGREG